MCRFRIFFSVIHVISLSMINGGAEVQTVLTVSHHTPCCMAFVCKPCHTSSYLLSVFLVLQDLPKGFYFLWFEPTKAKETKLPLFNLCTVVSQYPRGLTPGLPMHTFYQNLKTVILYWVCSVLFPIISPYTIQ